jgi:hypothetical protein
MALLADHHDQFYPGPELVILPGDAIRDLGSGRSADAGCR